MVAVIPTLDPIQIQKVTQAVVLADRILRLIQIEQSGVSYEGIPVDATTVSLKINSQIANLKTLVASI